MIHALPGMGADYRMYPDSWTHLPEFVAHDWTSYSGEKTLRDVARAMCEARHISDGDTSVGSSLGGMVACEITKRRRIPRLYLVGSAVRPEEVSRLRAILLPLARIAPLDWLRVSAGKIPTELTQMFSAVDANFIRAMCEAILAWEGLGSTTTEIYRLHGKKDLIIPPPPRADLLVDGGHLIAMTHARECTDFIVATNARRSSAH